jgi:hypothetical protein
MLTALLPGCAVLAFAQSGVEDWQTLMDQHAELTKQGQHDALLRSPNGFERG